MTDRSERSQSHRKHTGLLIEHYRRHCNNPDPDAHQYRCHECGSFVQPIESAIAHRYQCKLCGHAGRVKTK